ncbi:MAG: lecithin--cholesterol acyltransferase [Cyanobacteria bacterium P01_A01_bin.17]
MAIKAPMKDMVVILPGILGSVLQKDGKDIWAISGRSIWNTLTNSDKVIQDLKLGEDDPEKFDLGDGIRATRLMADAHLVPGLVKIDGYTQTSKLIADNFDVTPGDIYNDPEDKVANFYHFPYDWRRDNRANARILKHFLDMRLKRWREASGAQDAKVILLAHSMGGLVSRYYLEVLGGWQDARALFTFGTPYRGSFNAVNFIANGYKKLFLDLTEVLQSLTSVYQLLPIYKGIKIGNDYVRAAEADNLPNFNKAKAQDALKFHREIEAAVKNNQQNEAYRNFTTVPIVGVKQPTLQSAELTDGQLIVSESLPGALKGRPDLGDGDGTVPQVSAIPIELSNSFNNFFVAEGHGALQNQDQVLDDLKKKLELSQFDTSDLRAVTSGIGLALDDLYLPDEPIALRANVISEIGIDQLKAVITSVSHESTPLTLPFEQQQEQQWGLTLGDLPAGLYRVAVSAEGGETDTPSPVHNLFEVVRT